MGRLQSVDRSPLPWTCLSQLPPTDPHFGLLSYKECLSDVKTWDCVFPLSSHLEARFYLFINSFALARLLGLDTLLQTVPKLYPQVEKPAESVIIHAVASLEEKRWIFMWNVAKWCEKNVIPPFEDRITRFSSFKYRLSAVSINHLLCVRHQCHLIWLHDYHVTSQRWVALFPFCRSVSSLSKLSGLPEVLQVKGTEPEN